MKSPASLLWYAADLLAIAALLTLGVLYVATGRGLTPGEMTAGILAILAGRLTPRGPGAPPAAGHAPATARRRRPRLASSPGAIAAALVALVALWRRLWPADEPQRRPPTLHPA